MSRIEVTIGTRGSELALWQARFIRDQLERQHNCRVRLKVIRTTGDTIDSVSFDKMAGKGFFTKELEEALLKHEIDIAVHSLKDLMTTQPEGLILGAVGFRADCREMLLVRHEAYTGVGLLPVRDGAVIGTSSARRACQIATNAPTAIIRDLRGNVPTRITRLREGHFDAIVVAAAGVTRLGLPLRDLQVVLLAPERFLPAPAQGILGIQVRENDTAVCSLVASLNSEQDSAVSSLERGVLARFEGGCSLPLGVYSEVAGQRYRLRAILGTREGHRWGELKKADVLGDDIDYVVDRAFRELRQQAARCA